MNAEVLFDDPLQGTNVLCL